MINYELGVLIAVFAFTYTNILTDADMLMNGVYNWMDRLNNVSTGKKHWLFMVLIHCEKCVAGQAALWLYIYYNFSEYVLNFSFDLVFKHLFFITFAILCASIIKGIYNKHIKWN